MSRVAIIGGGPAGMMCASEAVHNGHSVTLYERNEKLGKKLFITGKGRCNLTNSADIKDFFENIPRNPRFLYSALYGFTNDELVAVINAEGVPTKVERGGRIFPQSDKSSDILRAMANRVKKAGVDIRLNSRVKAITKDENGFIIDLDGKKERYDAVVLATGGASYTSTGSTGDGYAFAKAFGHSVTPIVPSLISLETEEEWPKELMGLSLKNVTLNAYNKKKKLVYSELGEMLFTHFGVSGPLALELSAHLPESGRAEATLDLKPGLTEEQLTRRIARELADAGKKRLTAALQTLLPQRFAGLFPSLCGVSGEKPCCQITAEERARIARALKALPLTILAARPIEEAIVTRGGVDVRALRPAQMAVRSIEGLYFAGEVIDVDAHTGGYNLQIAFATGALAGKSAAEYALS